MTTHIPLLISVIVILTASLSGAIFTSRFLHDWFAPRLRYLVACAAGIFTVSIINLLTEAFHENASWYVGIAFLLGGTFFDIVSRLLPEQTHHHHSPHTDHHHGRIDARRMLIGDAIHNIHDGLALVPAFLVSSVVGAGTAAGILLHEVVQQIAEYFVLREAGYTARKALIASFAAQTTLILGVLIALILVSIHSITTPLIAFSAGSFTYIVIRDLIPSVIGHARAEGSYRTYVFAFCIGLIFMGAITFLVPHSDAHEEFLVPEGFGIAMK